MGYTAAMTLPLLATLLASSALTGAQPPVQSVSASFPGDFEGRWIGDLVFSRPGQPDYLKLPMSLRIEKLEEPQTYTFELKYGQQPVRPYVLEPVDPALGKWQINEGGGVLLASQWMADRFTSIFGIGVQNVSLDMWREGDKVIYQLTSFTFSEPGPGGVSSHVVTDVQRGTLKRISKKHGP